MANNSLNLVELDFELLKNSLKSYMQGQEAFRDYDFDGSNLSVLLDLLTYNTSKNVFYLNMLFAEAFLDSSQLRDSVLSHAKELNYTPRSARSAKATITVSFSATGESQPYVIEKGESFTTLIKNQSYVFSIPETITASVSGSRYSFTTDIYEGIYLKDSYVFKPNVDNQRFRISNKNVDTTSLTVVVYEDNDVIGDVYEYATTLLDVNKNKKVFFLQASENGYYEVYFGDGVIGRKPKNNALVVLDYRTTVGPLANRARNFTINFDPTGASELTTAVSVSTVNYADGGADAESIDSVKYYAPKHFQVQQRAAIPSDYEIILKEEFPEINAVSAYGGEDASPPQYGKVFVAVDVSDVDGIPDSKLEEYKKFLQRRTMLEPVIIEPEFSYIQVNSKVRYNINVTKLSSQHIKTLVNTKINNYNTDHLNKFSATLRYSDFVAHIDDADQSIISNVTDLAVYKKLSPTLLDSYNYQLDYGFKIARPDEVSFTVYSSNFVYNSETVFIGNTFHGELYILKANSDYKPIKKIGSVNYETGTVIINDLIVDAFISSLLKVFVIPDDKDIIIQKNTICSIEPDEINITVEALRVED